MLPLVWIFWSNGSIIYYKRKKLSPPKRPQVTIPCSKCGDSLRLNPFDIETGEEIKCPRCEQTFLPTDALIDSVNEIKEALIKSLQDDT